MFREANEDTDNRELGVVPKVQDSVVRLRKHEVFFVWSWRGKLTRGGSHRPPCAKGISEFPAGYAPSAPIVPLGTTAPL